MTNENSSFVFFDIGSLIHLIAFQDPFSILKGIPWKSAIVIPESERGVKTIFKNKKQTQLTPLTKFNDQVLHRYKMDEKEAEMFMNLISLDKNFGFEFAPSEAASIAVSHFRGSSVILENPESRKNCRKKFPSLEIFSFFAILRTYQMQTNCSPIRLKETIEEAISKSKMILLPDEKKWLEFLNSKTEF